MSKHILVVELSRQEQARLDAGELIFPEHIDDHEHGVICPAGNGCEGWVECREDHMVDVNGRGKSADIGPFECDDNDPWFDLDEYVFHGIVHTWRYGYGWTVPFTGVASSLSANTSCPMSSSRSR